MKREVGALGALPKTFSPTMLAPGAMPRMVMLQPAGSGWAVLTYLDRS